MANYRNELFTAFTGKIDASFTKSVQGVANSLTQLAGKSTAAVKPLQDINNAAKKGSPAVAKYGVGLSSIGGALSQIVRYSVAGSIIGGVTAAFAQGVAAIIDYDQSLKNLQAITGATEVKVGVLGDKIIEVSNNTKFSAEEVASAAVTLGQAGFSATETLQSLDAVASLATGTLSDFKTVADLLSTAVRAFQLSTEDSTRISDIFAISVNRSKLTIDKLRTAFNFVGASAAQAGLSLDQTAAAMQVLANNGIRASTIGTGLRNVLAKMLAPTTKIRKALAEAGIAIDDINPSIVGFNSALKNMLPILQKGEGGTISAGRAFDLFGLRGAQAATIIGRAFTSGDYQTALDNTQKLGEAARMQATQQEGLGVQVKNLADRWKNLAILLGDAGITAILQGLVAILSGMALVLQEVVKWVIKLEKSLGFQGEASKVATAEAVKLSSSYKEISVGIKTYLSALRVLQEKQEKGINVDEDVIELQDALFRQYPQLSGAVDKYRGSVDELYNSLLKQKEINEEMSRDTVISQMVTNNKTISKLEDILIIKREQYNRAVERGDANLIRSGQIAINNLVDKIKETRNLNKELSSTLGEDITTRGRFNRPAGDPFKTTELEKFNSQVKELGSNWVALQNKLFAEGDAVKIQKFYDSVTNVLKDFDTYVEESAKRGKSLTGSEMTKSLQDFAKAEMRELNNTFNKRTKAEDQALKEAKRVYAEEQKLNQAKYETEIANIKKIEAEAIASVSRRNGLKIDELRATETSLKEQTAATERYYKTQIELAQKSTKALGNTQQAVIARRQSEQAEDIAKSQAKQAELEQKIFEERMSNPQNFADAWSSALRTVEKSTKTSFKQISDFIANTIDQIADWGADAFIDFTTGTKSAAEAFSDMATSILRDLTKMIIKQQILNAIMAGAKSTSTSGGILGSIGSIVTSAFASNHSGGMAGKASSIKKRMDPSNFINAPKYHSGGEVPAILQRGEEVRTREQAAMDRTNKPISVIIENKTGSQVGNAEVSQSMDAGQQVINIILDGISRNRGGLRTAIAQTR